ncbi:hypothetical protein NUH88_07710 [Nisaea acidiphila]|uniref:Uncharacterized protein n=1 Tax=Nisaea acidiphila TaxID=1862145 RepID=A0A9J7AWS4_9PROT|nr:hypothetical protein [Nisaea acidiphila]UUX51574.1 hypothetical protein NUH88_07710 [Nisaea acidiphila]
MITRVFFGGLLLLLAGCVTTPEKPEPPVQLADGMGGFAMDLTIEPAAIKNLYFYSIAQYDPDTRKLVKLGDKPVAGSKVRHNYHIRKGGDFLWLTQLPPGHYAITEMEAKLSPGPSESEVVYVGDPIGFAIGGLLFLAIAEGTTDILPFVDDDDVLLPDAPTFEIQAGRMTYAGHLTVVTDPKVSRFPEYDRDGHWDGESMITKTVHRYMADYRYDEKDLTPNIERLNLSRYPLLPQPLSVFEDRRFVLEDYDDAETVRRSIPRSEHDTSDKAAAAAAS